MKRSTIFTFAVTMIMGVASIKSFAQEDKKSTKARKEVVVSEKELQETRTDPANDVQLFKKDALRKINENKQKITDLKIKNANENQDVKVKYDSKLLALENKNNALQNRIEGYENTKPSAWNSFRKEFTTDMDELADAIYNFGIDNKK